jgi:hypothetical protein
MGCLTALAYRHYVQVREECLRRVGHHPELTFVYLNILEVYREGSNLARTTLTALSHQELSYSGLIQRIQSLGMS